MVISNTPYPLFHPLSEEQQPLAVTRAQFGSRFPKEGQHVEFKAGASARGIQEAVTAFSNADGGVVLIGVDDGGKILGRDLTQRLEEGIHQAIAEIRNPGRYALTRLLVDDRPIVVLGVGARVESFAQTSGGRILVRRGPRNNALFDAELLTFLQTRTLDRFELRPAGISRGEASGRRLDELAEAYGWADDGRLDERLTELSLIEPTGELTVAGALYLLDDPAERIGKAFVEVLRYPDESADYDKRLEIRGSLDAQVMEATSAVLGELGTELVVLGVQRHEFERIPEVVIREAIANGVAHRSYEADRSAVRIEIRPDAVTVISPGPLPVPVTEENIRDAQAPRNLAVIRVLRHFGLAEDAGRGVDVMQDSMRAELLEPPSFRDTGHSVEVKLPIRTAVTGRERAWVREVERRGEIMPTDRIILIQAARGGTLTNRQVRDITGLDRIEATRALQRLKRAGFLRQSGSRGGSTYALDGSLRPPAGLRLSATEMRAAVLALAEGHRLTNAIVRERLGLDRGEALDLLKGLVRDGLLEPRGTRRGAHYVQTRS